MDKDRLYIIADDNVEFTVRFTRLEEIEEIILTLKVIGKFLSGKIEYLRWRLEHPTIASISLSNIVGSPECFYEIGLELITCSWAHDFHLFLEQVEKEVAAHA